MNADIAPGRNTQPPERVHHAIVVALLCALTFSIYFQVRDHEFIEYDDPIYITENPNLAAGFNRQTLLRAFSEPYETNWIPLTWISYHFDHAFFGLEPAGYHLVNVALHTFSAALLYFALVTMTSALGPSAFVAAVFAVHPVHVESVAWAAERKDTLSGVFWMLTLLAYARYARKPSTIALFAVILAFSLGLLAKPMLVTLPVVLLLLDYWPLKRLQRERSNAIDWGLLGRRVAEKLPLVAIASVVAWVTIVVQDDAGAMATEAQVAPMLRLRNALVTCWVYIGDSLWPSGLAIFYPHPMASTPIWQAGVAALGLVAATSLCVATARTRPYLIVGWLWYLITLLPVIGLIQVGMQARADRYLYLPQIGLTLAVAWAARDSLAGSRSGRRMLVGATCVAILTLSTIAWRQTSHWRDTATLYAHALAVTDENFLAHHEIAVELLESGDPIGAETHFERAIAIKPRWPSAHMGLGDARVAQGRVDESLVDYRRAIDLAPRKPDGHLHFARALQDNGKLPRATHHYLRAISLYEEPNAFAHANLASLYARTNELILAEEQYRRALTIEPGFAEVHANLAFLLIRSGRLEEARASLLRARQLGQDSAELHFAIAMVAVQSNDPPVAVAHFRRAAERRPDWVTPVNNLAWLLATHPDPDVREPRAAIDLVEGLRRPGERLDPDQLDTLAAAYAAAGRFEEAGLTASAAAQLARAAGRLELAAEIETRLRLYREKRPFIAPPHHSVR
jgi:tetratricopeptide (TPR) repeat protein